MIVNELVAPSTILDQLIVERRTFDLDGGEHAVTGPISMSQAEFMMKLIEERELRTCVETGVAFGASTVAICAALSRLEKRGLTCRHSGVDPCQFSDYNGAAVAALERCGLRHLFEMLEGPSHLMLPELIKRGEKVDMVFVDGWHTFDYTLIDVFLGDKLLRPGGVLLMHDMAMPSKRKVWKYLRSHRRYRRIPSPLRPLPRRVLSCGKRTLCEGPRAGFFHLTKPLLLAAEKISDHEPEYDYFRNF
ncbi:class I SAM-dependent methyltransferase [bacterium]|nr:class I SAM-dependent methyltransferase [bacterium]MBU1071897.1 class I SAM-dependent methyltransferase [bacterium]MBU1676739.1 class I SAM-dependent methyltransferase [bacterium]